MCSLKAHDYGMEKPVTFQVTELWHYDPKADRWNDMALSTVEPKTLAGRKKQIYSLDSDPPVRKLTDVKGLMWVKWTEDGNPFEDFIFSGMLCNDVDIGPARKGDRVAVCVPGKDSATAAYIPDPKIYCAHRRQ
jgi:hypothetical protein